ncbi:MAG: hypothetical protein ACI837_001552 [Crocinitomicaceae bacterium]|jgi:hypothetical protein
MKDIIKSERISYASEPLNWFSHYSISIMFIVFGLLNITVFAPNYNDPNIFIDYLTGSFPLVLGIILFFVQRKKLNYKSFSTAKSPQEARVEIRNVLIDNEWEIDHDTQYFIYAVRRKKGLYLGAVSFRFGNKKIKYNLHNRRVVEPLYALFSTNYTGKKLLQAVKSRT